LSEHVARAGDIRSEYNILDGDSEGERPLRRHRHRGEDNIKTCIKEIHCESVN